MEESNIDKLMIKYFDMNTKLKDITAKINFIKAEIKYEMVLAKQERYNDTKGNLVSYKTQKRKSLDKKRVREFITNEDDWNSCFNESEFEILRVMSKEQIDTVKKFVGNK